jgi:hypothetical protein
MTWQFGGVAYHSSRDYYAAIAREWLSANGLNTREVVRRTFAKTTDEGLVEDVIDAWDPDREVWAR